ncbi:MAG TPA: serine/threonine-protein kinase [Trebonia sp.]|nr:serine/threonine-protein kinase [Trebonia sp.]
MEPLQPGDPSQVGSYRLLKRLGEGGMGRVYLGITPGGRLVAVKVIRGDVTADPDYRRRLAREVQAAQTVGGFHTAHVVDANADADPPWMVTAFIAGPSLQAAVLDNGPLTMAAAMALGAALAEGLAAIHSCGLLHRDLKPGNIIMAADGPRIIDFGIARPLGASTLTGRDVLVGTYAYMSPEQYRGDQLSPASDVFALGCVLAFAATGHAPFEAETTYQIMYSVLEAEPALGEIGPGPFRNVVEQCLVKDHQRRPALPDVLAELSRGAREADQLPTQAISPLLNPPTVMVPTAPPGEAVAEQPPPSRHESVTIIQQANAAPGSHVIQIAGNAKNEGD